MDDFLEARRRSSGDIGAEAGCTMNISFDICF